MSELISDRLKISTELAVELPSEICQSEVALQPRTDSRLYSQRSGGALGAEQLRILQAHLTELQNKRPFKRLLVTSATRGEGKTHIAANLALTLATEGHRKVLLIDADVRNPSVDSALGIPNTHGFKDWLLTGGSPWKAVQKIKGTDLCVMTGGAAGVESLGVSRISCLETQLTQIGPAFDMILLDSPPLLGTVDTKLLSTVADTALIVVRAGTTPRRLVVEAQESLDGQDILGIVLNRLDPNQACFASYYGHPNQQPIQATKGKKA
jgi:capsular exopolysaccharide synthesis family protein